MTDPLFIGAREIWDLLSTVRANVDRLLVVNEQAVKRADDFENRIRSLERWRWGLVGAAPVIGAVSSVATHALQ